MAEIAIPLAILGGLYIVANKDNTQVNQNNENIQNKQNIQEGFLPKNNRLKPKIIQKELENRNTPHLNYPTQNTNAYEQELSLSPDYYPEPNQTTDKFYTKNNYINNNNYKNLQSLNQQDNMIQTMTGEKMNVKDFQHNNMVPFFGSSVKQNVNISNENRLDSMNGSGSQYFSKREQAPLFKPEKNMEWGFGMPNTSDFMQSRVNPSLKMDNVKPFQEVRVGPGLNDKGGVLGTNGFNAGMEARNKWLPKTVDELRVESNPKVSYGGVTLGGKDKVTNRGILGKVEKYRPDTYFINTPERYFTTTGIEKAQTSRGKELLKYENRQDTAREYFGTGEIADAQGPYLQVPNSFRPSRRPELDPNVKHVTNAHAKNKNENTDGDYGIFGYKSSVIPNNRSLTTERQPNLGIVNSFAKAVISPLLDVLRPSRKENVIGNIRSSGNIGSEHGQSYVYNPADRAKTTIREMTEDRPDHLFVSNQKEAGGYGYTVSNPKAYGQERDSTNVQYIGNIGNTNNTSNAMTYDSAYNAHLIDKEPISRGRQPMGDNVKLYNGQQFVNMKIDKLECDRNNNRMFVPQNIGIGQSITQQHIGQQTIRSEFGQDIHQQRMNPNDLSAFRNNPYTHSLSSIA